MLCAGGKYVAGDDGDKAFCQMLQENMGLVMKMLWNDSSTMQAQV